MQKKNMRTLLTVLATAGILMASSLIWKAEATPLTGIGSLPTLTKGSTPTENVYYYRRGYYGWHGPITAATATAGDGPITAATAFTAGGGPIIVVGGISRNTPHNEETPARSTSAPGFSKKHACWLGESQHGEISTNRAQSHAQAAIDA
jgi:hypothetical protein